MRKIWYLLLFLLVACNSKDKGNRHTYISTNKSQSTLISVADTTIINPILLSCLLNYVNDTSIIKYHSAIQMYAIGFYHENNDIFLSISGHCVLPVLSPQDEKDNYEYKGFYLFNKIPVLFYDYKKGCGYKFYNVGKLIKSLPKFYENPENRIGFSSWIYKVNNGYSIELFKKISEFRFK
jgi:hypothetical protein